MKIKAVKSSQKTIRYALIGTKKKLEIIIIFVLFQYYSTDYSKYAGWPFYELITY